MADVPESKRLVALNVSFGDHARTIVAGVRSEGMLFDIGHADGLPPALTLAQPALPDGARAG